MSEVENSVREYLQKDETLQTPGNCRDSVSKIAQKLKEENPNIKISFLAYQEAKKGPGVHYALLIEDKERRILVNAVKAPGFPVYIGNFESENTHPNFKEMKECSEVL